MRKVRWGNSPWLHYLDAFGYRLLLWRWTQSKFSWLLQACTCAHAHWSGLFITDMIFCFFSSFTYLQTILIWGNLLAFYMINLILSAVPKLQMYTIMFRLCSQPSYWITMTVSLLLFKYDSCHNTKLWPLQPDHILVTTCWKHLLPADCCSRNGSGAGFEVLQKCVPT